MKQLKAIMHLKFTIFAVLLSSQLIASFDNKESFDSKEVEIFKTISEERDENYETPTTEIPSNFDDAIALYRKLKETATQAFNTSMTSIQTTYQEIKNTIRNVSSSGKRRIDEDIARYKDEIEIEKARYNETKSGVRECEDEANLKLTDLKIELSEKFRKCIDKKKIEGNKIYDDARQNINRTYHEIDSLYHELAECNRGIYNIVCYATIATKMTWQITKLPFNMSLELAKATYLAATFLPSVGTCDTIALGNASFEGSKIIVEFTNCVRNQTDN